jgi:hypothetical protein
MTAQRGDFDRPPTDRVTVQAALVDQPAPGADGGGQVAQRVLDHGMIPGSHERGGGAECRCGAEWSRWAGHCAAVAGPQRDQGEEGQ